MNSYIYKITNIKTKRSYIGSRISHVSSLEKDNYWGSSKYLTNDIKKYGVCNFVKEILEENINVEFLLEKESQYIIFHNTLNPNGYNRCIPSNNPKFYTAGVQLSDIHKEKIRSKLKGRKGHPSNKKGKKLSNDTKEKISESLRNKTKSKEHKEKLSESLTGIIRSDKTKQKMSNSKKGKVSGASGKKWSYESKEAISKQRTGKKRGEYIKHSSDIICEHCGKPMSPNMYARWHGDNCKNNLNK